MEEIEQLLFDLRNMSDLHKYVLIFTRASLVNRLRDVICDHFGIQSDVPSFNMENFRHVGIRSCLATVSVSNLRIVLFRPDINITSTVGTLLEKKL